MSEVCVWCGEELPDAAAVRRNRVAYGVCPACSLEQARESGVPLESLLADLPVPIVLVDRHARVKRANVELLCDVEKPWSQVKDVLVGEVFECTYARSEASCGHTSHCSGCVLRRTIARTWRSGEAQNDVPGLLQIWRDGSPELRSFRLSTRRVGNRVLVGFTPELPAVMDDLPPDDATTEDTRHLEDLDQVARVRRESDRREDLGGS